MRIAIISNVTTEILIRMLGKQHEFWQTEGYGNWIQACLDNTSSLYRFEPDAIFLLLDGGELFPGHMTDEECEDTLHFAIQSLDNLCKKLCHSMIFAGTLDIPQEMLLPAVSPRRERKLENDFYNSIALRTETYKNLCFWDIKNLIENHGRNNFYDTKMKIVGGMPFSLKALSVLKDSIEMHLKAYSGKRAKVLALDLDNTLWGGVVGEDGPDGITLSPDKNGMPYSTLQMRAKELKKMGILLTVISKNNEPEVHVAFQNKAMSLKESDFAVMSVNWTPKPVNIAKQAKELNLGLDSFVFLDDNPVERETVKQTYPEVFVPDFPADISALNKFMQKIYQDYFFTIRTTEEDAQKTQTYQAEQYRKSLKKEFASIESYLHALQIKVNIRHAQEKDLDRIAQLTQKTNQFNLTTRRYTVSEIASLLHDPQWLMLTANASDKFGDNGLVALLFAHIQGNNAVIDTLLMSCRVMGRTIEHALLSEAENLLKKTGVKTVTGIFSPTAKNIPVRDFWSNMGYKQLSDNNGYRQYQLELHNSRQLQTCVECEK